MPRLAFALVLAACNTKPAMPDAPSPPWSSGPTMPIPRLEPGVAALGQRLVVAGGFYTNVLNGSLVTTRVDVLDPNDGTGAWLPAQTFADVPVLRHHIQLAAIGTTLYFLGGLDATPSGTSYPARGDSYSLDTLTPGAAWQPIAPMPSGSERGSAGIIVVPPRIYLIGGAQTAAALADVVYYDIEQNAWCPDPIGTAACQAIPSLPQPRSHPAVMRRLDGTFVVAGGLSGLFADSAVDDVWLLAPNGSAWTPGATMPPHGAGLSSARGGCAAGVIQSRLVCAGGEGGQAAFHLVQSYDAILDAWSAECDLPDDRAGTQGAAIGQRLFVPGGSRTLPPVYEPVDTLFVFAPIGAASCM